jgi:hypothetical protein
VLPISACRPFTLCGGIGEVLGGKRGLASSTPAFEGRPRVTSADLRRFKGDLWPNVDRSNYLPAIYTHEAILLSTSP